jgi:hypothetical protein
VVPVGALEHVLQILQNAVVRAHRASQQAVDLVPY